MTPVPMKAMRNFCSLMAWGHNGGLFMALGRAHNALPLQQKGASNSFPRPGLPLGPAPMADLETLTAADFPAITLDAVRAAAERTNGPVVRTPPLTSQTLPEMAAYAVWLKFENRQFTTTSNRTLQIDGGGTEV